MVRDTAAIAEDVVLGTAQPDPETTLEALIRSYNRQPPASSLAAGDLLQWDGEKLVKVDLSAAAENDLLQVQADGTVAPVAHDGTAGVHGIADTTQLATNADVQAALDNLVAGAPGALDTLNELAEALGDDPNFAATVTAAIAEQLTEAEADALYATVDHSHLDDDVQLVGGIAWHDAASATPDVYQALNASGGDAGALTGNTGYDRQTDVRPVNPFPQSKMRRCVLADDGETVAYYLDCDDSTMRTGDWLRIHEGVNDPVTPVPGQAATGSATLRANAAGWDVDASYQPGMRVIHDGALWEALVVTAAEPAPGTVAANLDGTDGQVMVEVPRFYVWSQHGSGRHAWEIACRPDEVTPFPDLADAGADLSTTVIEGGRTFTVHPAFQKAGIERTHRYIGAYRAHDNAGTLQTVSGQTYTASLTRDAFRTRIRARNAGLTDPSGDANNVWHLLDWDLWAALQLLLLTEYRTFHSQDVLGGGNTSGGDYAKTTGRANGIGNASGVYDATGALEVPTTGDHDGVAWRGIEDLFGSMWVWVDGWNGNDRDYLRCGTPADFADDTAVGYTSVAVAPAASASYPDSIADGLHFVPATVAGSSSTFVPDGHWNNSGWRVAQVGGSAGTGVSAGAFAASAHYGSGFASVGIGAVASR